MNTASDNILTRAPADKLTLWVVLVVSAFGVVAIYSAISYLAEAQAGVATEQFLAKHLIRVGLAFVAMAAFSFINYQWLSRFSRIALVASLALLVLVQFVGVSANGAERWIQVGALGFQPSDLAKVALIFYLAVLLARKQTYPKNFARSFVPLFVWILPTCILIGMENLSTALILLLSAGIMCFIGRVSMLHLGGMAAIALTLAVGFLAVSPHRAARVEAYLGTEIFSNEKGDVILDARHEGYQAQQARIAFAMGGLTGVGPGKSVQRDFLPAPYNDFIFAIIAEEYGLAGVAVLLGGFLLLLFRGFLRIARHAPDPLGLFLGVGLTATVVLYAFIHTAVTCGLLPVTGLPLPFVSYGGTALITNGIMIGILLNISRQARAG